MHMHKQEVSLQETNLYTITFPPMMKALKALSGVLDKAGKHAETKKLSWMDFEEALMHDRLIFDQFPFVKQVQVACDNAKNGVARLAEVEAPKLEDNEKTVAELKARIDATLKFLKTIKPEQVIGKEDIKIALPYWGGKHMRAFDYVTQYLLANFYFHVATAYSIMRKNGVQIGKGDFTGDLDLK